MECCEIFELTKKINHKACRIEETFIRNGRIQVK